MKNILIIIIICFTEWHGLVAQPTWTAALSNPPKPVTGSRPLAYTQVPYELVEGVMLVRARLDGETGTFILDTGAPTLIVNGKDLSRPRQMHTALGECGADAVRVGHFAWGDVQLNDIEALVMDLSHLERVYGRALSGVIGFRLLADRPMLVDTRRQEILLSRSTADPFQRLGRVTGRLPFQLAGHFPVVRLEIGSESYRFAFDSGCSRNLLDESLLRPPSSVPYRALRTTRLTGFSPEARETKLIRIGQAGVAGVARDSMDFLVADLSHLRDSDLGQVDGLLGYPTVRGRVFSIDYRRGEIRFWALEEDVAGLIP